MSSFIPFRKHRAACLFSIVLLFITSVATAQTWTGVVSMAWENAGNWSTGIIPNTASAVTIPSAPAGGRFPTISSGTQGAKDITIQPGATVSMTGGIFQLAHDWRNSGTFSATGGTFQFTGSAGGGSNFATGTTIFHHVVIDAGVNPDWSDEVNGAISIRGNFTNNNSLLSLVSANTEVTFNGSGDQTFFSASESAVLPHVVVNKPTGSLLLLSGFRTLGNFTHTAGTVNTGTANYLFAVSGAATFNGGSFLMNASAVTTGNWTNAGSSITGSGATITTADFTRSGGTFSAPGSTLMVSGNYLGNTANVFSISSITFSGTGKTIGGSVTTALPDVTVTGTVTMMNNGSFASLLLPAKSTATSLSLAAGTSLQVGSNITIQQPTGGVVASLNINAANVATGGNVVLGGTNTSTNRVSRIVLTTGTLTIGGNLLFNAAATTPQTAVIDQSGGANSVFLAGNLTLANGSGTITAGSTSTFVFNGTGNQSLQDASAISYNNLLVNKPSGTLSLVSNLSLTGALTLQSGNFTTTASDYSVQTGQLILAGGTFDANNSTVTLSGNYLHNGGSITGGGCAISIGGDYTGNSGNNSITNGTFSFTGVSKTIGGSVPAYFQNMVITTGTVTAATDIQCTSLTFANNNVNNSLTLANGTSIHVQGDVTIEQASGSTVVHAWNINNATATVTGNVLFKVTTNNSGRLARIVIQNGTLNINGDLVMNNTVLAANSVIDMTGGAGNINLSGQLSVSSLGTLTPGTASTFTFTGGANQLFKQPSAFTYNVVRVNKTGDTLSLAAAITTTATLQVDQGNFSTAGYNFTANHYLLKGGNFSAGNSIVTVNGNWTNNGGTYLGTGTTVLRGSGTIGGTQATNFSRLFVAVGSSKVMANDNTCTSLAWDNTNIATTFTHAGTAGLTVNGTVTLQQPTSGGTHAWNINNGSATVNGLLTFAGSATNSNRIFRLVITNGTLNAFGGLTTVASNNVTKVIDMSGGDGTINLKGELTVPSGTLTAGTAGSIFNYADDANPQTVRFFPAGAYHNLHINNSTESGALLGVAISTANVSGNVRVQTGTLNNNALAVTLNNGRTFEVADSGTYVLGGTTGMVGGTGIVKTFGATSTVIYGGTNQPVSGETYGHLILSGSGTKTLGGNATVRGALGLAGGSFVLGTHTLTLDGTVDNEGGTLSGGCTANLTINGSGPNVTLPTVSVKNMTINRAEGISVLGDITVCGVLSLASGIIHTNSFAVIISNGGSVTRANGHVNGNLRKYVPTGAATRTFEVGGYVYYTPVTVSFGNVTTAGNLTVRTATGDHANITSSFVSMLKSASRVFTLTNSGIVYNNYSVVFNFATADLDAIANPDNFIVGRYFGGTWTYPTVGTRTATTTQATGLTAFGDFQVGEYGNNAIKIWTGAASTLNWGDAANWSPVGVPTASDIVELDGAHTINININAVSNDIRMYNSGLVLTINSGVNYTVNGQMTINSGTLNTAGSFPSVSGTVTITGGTVGFTAASGAQTVPVYEYNHLTLSGGGTKTLAGNITPAGDLSVLGGVFDLGSFTCHRRESGGAMTIANGATLRIGGTNGLPANYNTHAIGTSGNIEFAGANQSITAPRSSQTYGNLFISGTGTKTLAANIAAKNITINAATLSAASFGINLSGNWTNNAVFNGGTGTVTFSGTTVIGGSSITTFKNMVVSGTLTAPAGTLNIAGNFTNNSSFAHNSGTVRFNGTSAISGSSQTTFHHLITSGQLTAPAGTMNVAGNWTHTGSFHHNSGTVNFNGSNAQAIPAINFHNLTSSSTGSRALPSSATITINGSFTPGTNSYTTTGSTIEFVSEGDQSVPAFSYFNLAVSGYATTKTAATNLTVNGALDIEDSATLNMGNFVLSGAMTIADGYGMLKTQNTSATPLPANVTWGIDVFYNSATTQTIVAGNYTKLNGTGGNRTLAPGVVGIADTFVPGSGTYTTTGNTVHFNGSANQTIPVLTYNGLTYSGAGTTKTAAGNLTVNGGLTTNEGVVFDLATFTLGGTLTSVAGSGTVRTANTSATPLPLGKTWPGTTEYYSALAQTIVTGNYSNLNGSGGNRTLASAGSIGIAGVFTTGAGTYTTTGSTVIFNGTADQEIPLFSFQHLTIHKTSGKANLTGNITVNGNLTFTSGNIATGSHTVILASTSNVVGAAQATGWVDGNVQRHFTTGTNVSRTYPVGTAVYYSPVTVNFLSVGTAGTLTLKAVAGDHPGIDASVISSKRNVNTYWSVAANTVAFTTATVTFNWAAAAVDASADPSFFKIARFAATWSQPAETASIATSIQATSLTAFGDFAVGELLNQTRWTGILGSNWSLEGNWSLNALPVATNNILIPENVAVYPVLSAGTQTVKDLTIESGASLTVSGATLQISGSLVNEGSLDVKNGTLELIGTTPQAIPSGVFVDNTIKELTINNNSSVTLEGPLDLTNLLLVKSGILYTNDFLSLKATATTTASVGPITSVAATPIVGDVTVERFVPGRRKYRLIAPSVTTSTKTTLAPGEEHLSMWAQWQNSGVNAANAGTLITGGTTADGFDPGTTNASLFTYNESTRKFVAFSSANGNKTKNTPLQTGKAYYMFVYGNRMNKITATNPYPTVLRAKGTLATGPQAFNTSSAIPLNNTAGNFTLIGNPYASPVDWRSVNKSGVSATLWGWDANLNSTGGYVTVTATASGAIVSPISNQVQVSRYIQPGQGFFVKTTAANPQVMFNEAHKVSNLTAVNNQVFRAMDINTQPLMAINLLYSNAGVPVLADGAVAAFDKSFAKSVSEDEDGVKMVNSNDGLSLLEDGTLLGINSRPLPTYNDTLQLSFSKLTKTQYTLEIFAQDLTATMAQPYLQDTYLNSFTPLSLTDTNRIVFNVVSSDAASSGANRFRIIFNQMTTLPVTFVSVAATKKEKQVAVEWKTGVEAGIQKFEVERAAGGSGFLKVGELTAKGGGQQIYQWLDTSPLAGSHQYRIRSVEGSDRYLYSKAVSVMMHAGKASVSVVPNPVKAKQINIVVKDIEKGVLTVLLFDQKGNEIIRQAVDHPGGTASFTLSPRGHLAGGIYYLKLVAQREEFNVEVLIE